MMPDFLLDTPIPLALRKEPIVSDSFLPLVKEQIPARSLKTAPAVSVVLVAHDERDELLALIRVLERQTIEKEWEIIFVDNGIDPDIAEAVKKSSDRLTYVSLFKNVGASEGRNVGSSYARAPILVFIDADGLVTERLLAQVIERFAAHQSLAAVRGRVVAKTANSYVPHSYDLGPETFPAYIDTEGISAWKADAYKTAGGFEATLYGGEGVVLCYRLIELYGYRYEQFVYDPRLTLYHDYSDDIDALLAKAERTDLAMLHIRTRYPFMPAFLTHFRSFKQGEPPARQPHPALEEQLRLGREKIRAYRVEFYTRLADERWAKPFDENKDTYRFTVVIPCYNLGETLWKAVDSIFRQTLRDVEVVIVDDCSTDPATIEKLRLLEENVKVIYLPENRGVSAARNAGVRAAKADFILCLDADDTVGPTYLEEAYNVFLAYPDAGIVSAGAKFQGLRSGIWNPPDNVGIPDALLNSPIPTASCFRKEAWSAVGGYDEAMRGYEDWNFWLTLLAHGWRIRVLPSVLYNYNVRTGSKSFTSNSNAIELVSCIVNNNREMFEKYFAYIIGSKHAEVVTLRQKVQELQRKNESLSKSLQAASGKPPQPKAAPKPWTVTDHTASVATLVLQGVRDIYRETVRTKDPRAGAALLLVRTRNALRLISYRLAAPRGRS